MRISRLWCSILHGISLSPLDFTYKGYLALQRESLSIRRGLLDVSISPNIPNNVILRGDCIDLMRRMPSNSIDFILTDPPYLVNYCD